MNAVHFLGVLCHQTIVGIKQLAAVFRVPGAKNRPLKKEENLALPRGLVRVRSPNAESKGYMIRGIGKDFDDYDPTEYLNCIMEHLFSMFEHYYSTICQVYVLL